VEGDAIPSVKEETRIPKFKNADADADAAEATVPVLLLDCSAH